MARKKREYKDSFPFKTTMVGWGGIFGKEVTFRGKKYYFYKASLRLTAAKRVGKELIGKGYKVRLIVPGLMSGYGIYTSPKVKN